MNVLLQYNNIISRLFSINNEIFILNHYHFSQFEEKKNYVWHFPLKTVLLHQIEY